MKHAMKYIYILPLLYAIYNCYDVWSELEMELVRENQAFDAQVAKVQEKENELKKLDIFYKDVDLAIENIKLVMAQVKDLQGKLPSKNDNLANLQTVKNLATSLNMNVSDLASSKEEQKDFYFVTRYNLKASGTYLQFLLLLEQISKGERMLNIPAIELKERLEKQKGQYVIIDGNVTIEAYRYNPQYEESADVVGDILNKYSDVIEKKNKAMGKKTSDQGEKPSEKVNEQNE